MCTIAMENSHGKCDLNSVPKARIIRTQGASCVFSLKKQAGIPLVS